MTRPGKGGTKGSNVARAPYANNMDAWRAVFPSTVRGVTNRVELAIVARGKGGRRAVFPSTLTVLGTSYRLNIKKKKKKKKKKNKK